MRNRTSLATALAIAAAALGVVACGDDEENGTSASGAQSNGAQGSEKPAGPAIKIGLVCTCSGPQASANGPSKDVAEAWESWTNDRGGLNGHPVEVIIKDDAGDPARSAKAVRELVEQDKVMAIAGQNSLADAAWQKYVEQKGMPVVGGVPYNPAQFTSPTFFPSGASLPAEFYGFIDAAKREGVTKLGAFYCAEAATCAQVAPVMKGIATQVVGGSDLVHSAKVAATAPNYTAQCLAAKEAGVQGLFIAASPTISARIYDQCAQQGFKPRVLGINGAIPVAAAKDEKFDGAILSQGNMPPDNLAVQGNKDLKDALDTYAKGLTDDPNWNANPSHSWAGLQLFAKAAESGKLTPTSTADDVKTALYGLKGETIDGLAGPLAFTEGKPTLNACPFVQIVKNGEWTYPAGDKPSCVPPAKLALLGKALGG